MKIKEVAILIGYDANGKCVYNEILDVHDYFDGIHVWDSDKKIKKLRMTKLKGYIFDTGGKLAQEFENSYDKQGKIETSSIRFADGTIQEHKLKK